MNKLEGKTALITGGTAIVRCRADGRMRTAALIEKPRILSSSEGAEASRLSN